MHWLRSRAALVLWALLLLAVPVTAPAMAQTHLMQGRRIAVACETNRSTPACEAARRDDAFEIAQSISITATAAALARVTAAALAPTPEAARVAAGFDRALRHRDESVTNSLNAIVGTRTGGEAASLTLDRANVDLETWDSELRAVFPAYADLKDPKPLPLAEAQSLLGPDQALVFYSRPEAATFVWVITRETASWTRLDMSAAEIAARIGTLRRSLEPSDNAPPFDAVAAHRLYLDLIAPVASIALQKHNIIIVPSGPLLSLPFAALPVAAPLNGAGLRSVKWLGLEHALVVLPHPSSLRILRAGRGGAAARAFIGFGAPTFRVVDGKDRSPVDALLRGGGWTSRGVDQSVLESLDPLPGTARELAALQRQFANQGALIHTGDQATETAVKSASLSDYRIVSFATHGILPSELAGLAEAGLVLTPPRLQSPPATPGELDDGFLAVSEAAQLRLNADWVILSACNTAQGGKAGDEGLSGLARAFFFAGARALLVSQWAVDDIAAQQLVVRTLAGEGSQGNRAEALRLAMRAVAASREYDFSHPRYWAPYVLVGDTGSTKKL